jgi:hypothetical protein
MTCAARQPCIRRTDAARADLGDERAEHAERAKEGAGGRRACAGVARVQLERNALHGGAEPAAERAQRARAGVDEPGRREGHENV